MMLGNLVSPPVTAFVPKWAMYISTFYARKSMWGSVYGRVDNAMEMHDPVMSESGGFVRRYDVC